MPNRLSELVVQLDALIGDIWRLACIQVKKVVEPKVYRISRYEQLFEIAKRFSSDNGNVNFSYIDVFHQYKLLCQKEFNITEVQERRLGFYTPSRRLKPDLVCRVAPPEWDLRPKESRRRLFFGCHRRPPVVEIEFDSRYCCVICGYKIDGKDDKGNPL